jgi:hypothetical protein
MKKLEVEENIGICVSFTFILIFGLFVYTNLSDFSPSQDISESVFSYGKGANLSTFENEVDKNGIPIVTGGYTNKTGYHPTPICRYGVYLTSRYKNDPNDEDLEKIKNVMNWIQDNKVNRGRFIVWYLNEDLESFGLEAPWTSAMTNAFCAGALLRGSIILEDRSLERDAKKAIEYLFVPVRHGGGMHEFENGDIWFEEAPSTENPSHILNGCIFALDILDMFRDYYDTPKYENHYQKIVRSLRNRVHEYDTGYGSVYDLWSRNNKLGMSYHRIHFVQMYYLYLSTGDEYFRDLSLMWFEFFKQSEYKVLSTRSTVVGDLHSEERLNEGIYWYRYWQAHLPAEVETRFGEVESVKGINFFGLSGGSPFDEVDIYYLDNDQYRMIKKESYEIEYGGLNISGDNRTNVFCLKFDNVVETTGFKFVFNEIEDREYVYLREIGFWKEMEEEYEEYMESFSSFEEITETRND